MDREEQEQRERELLAQAFINQWVYWTVRNQRAKQREADAHQSADEIAEDIIKSLEAVQKEIEDVLNPLLAQADTLKVTDGETWLEQPWSNSERIRWNEKKRAIIAELESLGIETGTQEPIIAANQASAAKDKRNLNRARAVRQVVDLVIAENAAREVSDVKSHLERSLERAAEDIARELEQIENGKQKEAQKAATDLQEWPQDAKSTSQGTNTRQTQNNAPQATGTPNLTPTIPESTPTFGSYDQSVVFDRPTPDQIRAAVNQKIDGRNFSDRIWKNKKKLAETLKATLFEALLNGEGVEETARKLAQKLNASFNDSLRLIRTETNRVLNQATLSQMKAAGIEWYTFTAIIDDRTTAMCRFMNLKRFKVSEAQVGINYPPLHPNCRSTVVAGSPAPDESNDAEIPPRADGTPTSSADAKETIDIDKAGNVINRNGEPDVSWIREMTADWAREVSEKIKKTQPEAAQQIETAADKVAKRPSVENIRKLTAEQDKANARKDERGEKQINKSRKSLGNDEANKPNKSNINSPELSDEERYKNWLGANAREKETEKKTLEENRKLRPRQKELNEKLKKSGDFIIGTKKEIQIKDISHLTALNGVEYSIFTKGNMRMIIRGTATKTPISNELFKQIIDEGWKLSAHTHPGISEATLSSSPGDVITLQTLNQGVSVVLNSLGESEPFNRAGMKHEKTSRRRNN